MSQALYRKYRSRSLSEVVGQEHITETLARAIQAGHIGHAYLFTGPRGTGKTSVARILAHEINNLKYSDAPQLDIVEIDAASNRRIDDIRDLREKVHIAPINAKYKVYIIDEVHMLTGESFNALLKTLEEPPSHVVFILATTEVHKLPATIISRTQRFAFKPGTKDKVVAHLKMIAEKEKIDIEDAALDIIAEHGEGSYRDSLSLLDQLTHISTGTITATAVALTLGLAPKERIAQLVQVISDHESTAILETIRTIEEQGSNPAAIVEQLTKALLAVAPHNPSFFELIDKLLDVPRAYNPRLKLIAILAATGSPTMPLKKSAPALVAPVPTLTIIDAPQKPAAAVAKPAASSVNVNTATDPLDTLDPEAWNKTLQLAKEKSPPMLAILKHAAPAIEGQKLVLTFKFSLMAKKLEDPKQKSFIAELLQQTTGKTPAIAIVVDKNAKPPVFTDNPHISSVTAIMGGGEVIHAEAI